jgi:phosphatidylinositol alpha-1,6-mannosyltransferase
VRALCLLTDGFGMHGGIAQFNRDFLKAICAHPGITTVIALPRNIVGPLGEMPGKLLYDLAAARSKFRFVLSLLGWLVERPPFDVIICTHLNLQPLAMLAHWLSGAPSMLVIHGVEAWTPPKKLARRVAATRAQWVAAVSRYTLDRFSAWATIPRDRAVILPCCVNLERFTPGEPAPSVLQKYRMAGKLAVLTLGRLAATERYKGFDELLENLARLRAAYPNLVCVIAGAGDDRARLEAKARALEVADYVRFTGFVPDAELVELYRAARAFVLAGCGEGFGIVLLEAMACGVPVVASILDGSFEAVRGGELGVAVDPRDRDALVAGIGQALQRPVGKRPQGLDYFAYPAFEARVHALLARIGASPRHLARHHGRLGTSGQPPAVTR